MTVYQVAFMTSDDHVACRFDHTLAQSIVGCSCVIHMSLSLLPAMSIVRTISYTLCLNALGIPLFLGGGLCRPFSGQIYVSIPGSSVSSIPDGVYHCRHYLSYALSRGWENLRWVPEFC